MAVNELNAADFAQFFTELWDNPPFAWQQELAKRVLERADTSTEWPEVIALPTASGKTACMDIAVFALAAQASRLATNQAITAPRRIFFVVDRRIIVDQAHERARLLSQRLRDATGGILKDVADRLRKIARGEMAEFDREILPLATYALRGGMYRSEAWARDPLQPMVVASTVDQIGSRLLFRAYGRGISTWPVYAGLVANDSLILLDEAHCAKPFLQTLQAVRKFRDWAHTPLMRSFHPVVMSATPPNLSDVFKDISQESLDSQHPLGKRQLAHKPAMLKKVSKATDQQATGVFAKALAETALDLTSDQLRAIVVFVNRVATARETYKLLNGQDDIDAVLLTGRMRPVDKDVTVQRLKILHSDRSAERDLEKPFIVVATQTLEVGADLDFDGLVTECASLDALRQRFGRLNRMGRDIEARAAILIRGDQVKLKKGDRGDPVYGTALAKTWDWLTKKGGSEVDFGIIYLDQQLADVDSIDELNAPSLDAPVMLPAHIDCWAQTAPVPHPSPDVGLFLHGPEKGSPDVHVCWRADLDLASSEGQDLAREVLKLCPPSSLETLPVPIWVLRRWLCGEESDESTDIESAGEDDYQTDELQPERKVIRWQGSMDIDIILDPAKIRPGDIIVVPTSHPARYDTIGNFPSESTETVDMLDVGDQAYRLARAKPLLRLHRKLVEAWPRDIDEAKKAALELLTDIERKHEENVEEVNEALASLLAELSRPLLGRWDWLSQAAQELSKEYRGDRLHRAYRIVGDKHLIIIGNRRIASLTHEADIFSDEDDISASGISHGNGQPVKLQNHLRGVESFVRRYALGCGLSADLTEALACAGLLHDVGKADPRFQSLLCGGNPWLVREHLAKSAYMPKGQAYLKARKASGYPKDARHELLSVRLAENAQGLLPDREDLRDLVLHLIASHHGHCRPFAPVVFDETCETVNFELLGQQMSWSGPTNLERLDSGISDRYWQLVQRYGWWGLAWLEALLRLADWRRSEWEQIHNDKE